MRVLVLLVLLLSCGPVASARADEWRWPLDGPPTVARAFSAPVHRYASGHRGADLPSVPGAAVRAAGGGVVSYAGLVAGRGVVVVVHGPLRTTYEPVSALVAVGSVVEAGQVVGVLQERHAGCPVLACLHWGLRRGEDYLDPVRLVAPGPVRLLPLDGPATGAGAGAGGGAAVEGAAVQEAAVQGAAVQGAAVRGTGASSRLLAPGDARARAPAVSRPVEPGPAAAAAILGVAAVGLALRRRG